ncbi:hypothetical protein OB236_07205 [Paenibacillus sp. WQ 127069]|uniref:ATPase AAA-type core domain-containing protein n=1 Tax=Paenibacillus baimaensis TaxID=2982185 RepID=A0ABT2UBA2_9BACL|nr:hypothetical protein [Paenibacillus sp. WQ 127069]MCU6791910.1 hypothetical protein [Paenibacillus sp. WQ 127069]
MNGSILSKYYRQITQETRRIGDLKKCEFHIHTPVSHDYQLIEGSLYKRLAEEEVINYAWEINYFNNEQREHMLNHVEAGLFKSEVYLKNLASTPYESFKEYLAYKLIAHSLYIKNIEVAIISDHNTILGYHKLNAAISEYFIERYKGKEEKRKCIHLMLGVEITCSEQIHLIGLFDSNMHRQVQKLIDDNIISAESGTYETCLSMLMKIKEIGGMGYIAHINSTEIRTTGLYKQTLFGHPDLNIIGLTNKETYQRELSKLRSFNVSNPDEKFCFVYEGDAHTLNQIGVKNTWIKLSDISFSSLKKAFLNHKFCVFIDKPIITDKYIKGLLIEPGQNGYLQGRDQTNFAIEFSHDLNCVIGGRGTGKSTLLTTMEVIFTLEVDSDEKLRFICRNKMICIIFYYQNKEFFLRFIPQTDKANPFSTGVHFYSEKAFIEYRPNSGKIVLGHHWNELYEVSQTEANNLKFEIIEEEEKLTILRAFYRKSYSINHIVNEINHGKIGYFIREAIFNGLPFEAKNNFLRTIQTINKQQLRSFLRKELPFLNDRIEARKSDVIQKLKEFNFLYERHLQIIYSPNQKKVSYFIDPLTEGFKRESYFPAIKFTWGDAERFIEAAVQKLGYLELLILLLNDNFREIEKNLSISKFVSNSGISFKDINEGREPVNTSNVHNIYKMIKNKLTEDRTSLEISFGRFLEITDDFSLVFNVNSKELVGSTETNMKEISQLSLGQKVVAILTFLFEYGKFSHDNTPLIIDQPEDNLDNQYIYKNLVKSLRLIKNSRQVIIVTHSSTIVTNADAEQVIVLESDNNKGWVEKSGYPSNAVIMKHIINYLEGGEPSFKHKMDMYGAILNR